MSKSGHLSNQSYLKGSQIKMLGNYCPVCGALNYTVRANGFRWSCGFRIKFKFISGTVNYVVVRECAAEPVESLTIFEVK